MRPKLNYSPVVFDELPHTYTATNGKLLSGITSLIHKYVFPNLYDNVDQAVLKRRATYGSLVHSQIQMIMEGMPFHEELPETKAFRRVCGGIKFIESEYLVSDDQYVASSIDLVDEHFNLYDIKTTHVLNIEYLRWQLSMYALLFEMQNPGLEAGKLYAIHLRGDEVNVVEIDRITVGDLLCLYDAHRLGLGPEKFVNPLHRASGTDIELADEYAVIEGQLADLRAAMKPLEARQESIMSTIKERMDNEKNKKIDNERFTITRVADSSYMTYKFDAAKFLEGHKPTKEMKKYMHNEFDYKSYMDDGCKITDAIKECVTEKEVVRKGKVTIKFK